MVPPGGAPQPTAQQENDAAAAAERADAGGWTLFALQHPTNVTRAWTELEWE